MMNGPVVGIGELLWDCFPGGRHPGGAPANVAFHASQLGHDAAIVSRVGDDELGRELRDYLSDHGLSTGFLQVDPARPTGTVTVDTTNPERPAYTIHEDVAWDAIEFTPQVQELMSRAAAVCVGTLAQRGPVSRSTIQACLEAAGPALVVFDVNLRQSWFDKPGIEAILARAGVLKLNVDEVAPLAHVLEQGATEPVGFARELIARSPVELVCVTRAERGCLLVGPGEIHDLPGVPVQLADAVGAGDAFTAALISARLRGWSTARSGRFANAIGALVASHAGAMPDVRQEMTRLVEQAEGGRLDATG